MSVPGRPLAAVPVPGIARPGVLAPGIGLRFADQPYATIRRKSSGMEPWAGADPGRDVCNLEQPRGAGGHRLFSMQLEHIKALFVILWIVAVVTAGFLGNVGSMTGWTILAVLAVLPPLVVMRRWRSPDQSMSESIREAIR